MSWDGRRGVDTVVVVGEKGGASGEKVGVAATGVIEFEEAGPRAVVGAGWVVVVALAASAAPSGIFLVGAESVALIQKHL